MARTIPRELDKLGNKELVCPICHNERQFRVPGTFTDRSKYAWHCERHVASSLFKCPLCRECFPNLNQCMAHEGKVHNEAAKTPTNSNGSALVDARTYPKLNPKSGVSDPICPSGCHNSNRDCRNDPDADEEKDDHNEFCCLHKRRCIFNKLPPKQLGHYYLCKICNCHLKSKQEFTKHLEKQHPVSLVNKVLELATIVPIEILPQKEGVQP